MDDIDRKIINGLQDGFPVCASPYQLMAVKFGLTETELISRINKLLDKGTLSRFGPMYDAEQMGGALTLAAVKVPEDKFQDIAEVINAFPEVAHNYARSHELNMWFVLATETPGRIEQVIQEIEAKTHLTVYNMPKINEYYVGLKLEA